MREFDFSVKEIRSIGTGFKVLISIRMLDYILARTVFIIEYKSAIRFKCIFTFTMLNPGTRLIRRGIIIKWYLPTAHEQKSCMRLSSSLPVEVETDMC